MLQRLCTFVMLLAMLACGGGGGGGAMQEAPTDRKFTVRLIGPNGEPFYPPGNVMIVNRPIVSEDFQTWRLQAWADGVFTDGDKDPLTLTPGEQYDLSIGSFKPGVFFATNVTFTAPADPIDLGTIDLSLNGFSMTTPVKGSTAAAYPVLFAWTPYANPAAQYKVEISNRALKTTGPTNPPTATSYSLSASDAATLGQRDARWQVTVTFTTPEGYSVTHTSDYVDFTLPE